MFQFDYDPVMGAMGLSLGSASTRESEELWMRRRIEQELENKEGAFTAADIFDALHVEIKWTSRLLNRSRWFIVVPKVGVVNSMHDSLMAQTKEVEHKLVSNSRVMLYTSTNLAVLLDLLHSWLKNLKGEEWGVKTLVAYRYV